MYIEKYGANHNGLSHKKQTFRQICNRLQHITHYFLDECQAEKYYELAKMYTHLSLKDRKQFDYIIDSMQAWLDYVGYDGAGTTKLVKIIGVMDEFPQGKMEEI